MDLSHQLDVRMLGVDAPEIAHNSTEVADCYGNESADWTRGALLGRQVELSFDATCTDKYGRALAYVLLTDDTSVFDVSACATGECTFESSNSEVSDVTPEVLVNDLIIRYGYARVYEEFDNIRLADLLYESQAAAKAKNLGLWANCE